ncbi:MAG TPA: NAD(P)/FAD-dependent oxidoreductase [Bacteroidales bacterium]|jgi:flavin-dependent dehydrogenase|nr:NAD(P)/FAD-dependent oxidoreductase [Bacteroidales bacterium]MDI9573445.1 NAD(P)/FAD-dependent oxidoreductase [Bacteroidota bacterium]OQC61876.1 MAG: putative oxidoreductase [Bacteroidetes bacterium ADurb.Bin012]MBP9511248.1 NAD(P)/FAD-dependent oxidoreductase [Bacteroidales bacterium]MBP9587669.1 NAD(P)/FAD-dependent oxidoreductase [Bacteroidales bacterium]
MDSPDDCDVAIAGAGPAGLACALTLKGRGLKIKIFDKKAFPRSKPCGGELGIRAINTLRKLSFNNKKLLDGFDNKNPIYGFQINTLKHNNYSFLLDLQKNDVQPMGYTVNRQEFDFYLLQNLLDDPFIEFYPQTSVLKTLKNEGNIELITEKNFHKTSILIDATGVKHIRDKSVRNSWAFAISSFVKDLQIEEHQQNILQFYFTSYIFPGYFWIFPLQEGLANVGLYVPITYYKASLLQLRHYFFELIQSHSILAGQFQSASLASSLQGGWLPLGYPKGSYSEGRILKVGDAARLVDPLAGEGIGNALLSGHLAGLHILKCFEENNFSDEFLSTYNHIIANIFEKEFKSRHRIVKYLSKHPKTFDRCFHQLSNNRDFRKFIFKIFLSSQYSSKLL